MPYLFLAIVCGASLSVCFKVFKKISLDSLQGIFVNYITAMAVSMILSGTGVSGLGRTFSEALSSSWLWLAIFEGVLFMSGILALALSTQRSGIAVTNVAARASLVLPVLASWLLYHEGRPKWAILLLLLLSMSMIFGETGKGKKISFKDSLLPLLVFFVYGACDFFLKVLKAKLGDGNEGDIMLFIFSTAALCCLAAYLLRGDFRDHLLDWRALPGGIVLGLLNSGCTALMMKALGNMEAVIFFPVYNAGVVCLSLFAGTVLFKEKLSTAQIIGIILAIISIVLFIVL